MRSLCGTVAKKHKINIHFTSSIKQEVPREVSVCLFRVLQEALLNAVKHSGSAQIDVDLSEASKSIRLTVRDSGSGFDTNVSNRPGLGLISMEERVRMLRGNFSIESRPNSGTTVRAAVPLRKPA